MRNTQWQQVTTFNEWGEGTSIELAREWASSYGYGAYLDLLHSVLGAHKKKCKKKKKTLTQKSAKKKKCKKGKKK